MGQETKPPSEAISLAERIEDRATWPTKDRLRWFQELVDQVHALHKQGKIHRAIHLESVGTDADGRPVLAAAPDRCRFGGTRFEPARCPLELTGANEVQLPGEISQAAHLLEECGHLLDPRRVDIHQLGALLCRLTVGESVLGYMVDPRLKTSIAKPLRSLIDSTLGHDASQPIITCDELSAAVESLLEREDLERDPQASGRKPASDTGHESMTPNDAAETVGPKVETDHELINQSLGHYRIERCIASGGMGSVYEGHDTSLDRRVAIKVLARHLTSDERFVKRFHAEATATAKIIHPNVVTIHAIDQSGVRPYFVMEFVEGESLSARLSEKRQLSLDETLDMAQQCLQGLHAAHTQGLVHRDIKPSNLLIENESGRIVLVDFGLVRHLHSDTSLTDTGVIMGTVDYIAPEQARGRAVDGRADLYSLGVMLYRMLAGRLPFVSDSPTDLLFQHAYDPPRRLSEVAPDVPSPIAAVITRLLAKEPDERYPDALAALAALQAARVDAARGITRPHPVLSTDGPSPQEETDNPKPVAATRSRRTLLLGGAMVGLVVIGGVLTSMADSSMFAHLIGDRKGRERVRPSAILKVAQPADVVPLDDPRAQKLSPGLVAREYPRHARQGAADGGKIDPQRFGPAVGDHRILGNLSPWRHDASRNATASGYLRIEQAGVYSFTSSSYYDRNMLILGGTVVGDYSDGMGRVSRIRLPRGYIPLVSVAFVESREDTRVEWIPPGRREAAPVPSELFHHDPTTLGSKDDPLAAADLGTPSLIGRATVGGRDIGLLLRYYMGGIVRHADLQSSLFRQGGEPRDASISLSGVLHTLRETTVAVQHYGGSSSQGVHSLFIDDRLVGEVGDDRPKEAEYMVPLTVGTHAVRWVLTGGDFGRESFLRLEDAATGLPVRLEASDADIATAMARPANEQLNIAPRPGTPVPRKPD